MGFWITYTIPVVMGCVCSVVALGRGRSPVWWFLVGMILGWIGLIVLFIIPPAATKNNDQEKEDFIQQIVIQQPKEEFSVSFNWFYLDQKKEVQGPFSAVELKEKWKTKIILGNSWVWNKSIDNWKKISEVILLAEWLKKD